MHAAAFLLLSNTRRARLGARRTRVAAGRDDYLQIVGAADDFARKSRVLDASQANAAPGSGNPTTRRAQNTPGVTCDSDGFSTSGGAAQGLDDTLTQASLCQPKSGQS
ncbi:hypothetical protein GCM10027597_05400 [Saccharopolyspora tripterygii]